MVVGLHNEVCWCFNFYSGGTNYVGGFDAYMG